MKNLFSLTAVLFIAQFLTPTPAQNRHQPELYVQTGHTSLLENLVLSPSGKFVASQDWTDRNIVKIWLVKDGKELRALWHSDYVSEIVFSVDEKFIFVASLSSGEVTKWSVETGDEVDTLKCNGDSVRLSDDARLALCRSYSDSGASFSLWDLAKKKVLWSLPMGTKGGGYRLSPDWKRLFVTSDKSLTVIDVDRGTKLNEFSPYEDSSFEILDNGTWLLLFLPKEQRILWNTNTGERINVPPPRNPEDNIKVDSSGKTFIFIDDQKDSVELFSIDRPTQPIKIKLTSASPICSVNFSDDKQSLLVAETGGIIRKLSLEDGLESKRLETGGKIQFGNVPTYGRNGFLGYFPNCDVKTSPSGEIVFARPGSWISVWDWGRQKQVNTFGGFSRRQNVVAFSPDENFLASGGAGDGLITIFPLAGSSTVKYLAGHETAIYALAYNKDGSLLASADIDGIVKLWDIQTGRELRQYKVGHWVWDVAFSPDGKLLATADESGWINIWLVNETRRLISFKSSYTIATAVAFSPDGSMLLSGDVNGVCDLWAIATGKHIRGFSSRSIQVLDTVAFSKDGKFITAGSIATDTTSRYPSVTLTPAIIRDKKGRQRAVHRKMFEAVENPGVPNKEDPVANTADVNDSPEKQTRKNEFIFVWEIATGKLTKTIERKGIETSANHGLTVLSLPQDKEANVVKEGSESDEIKFVLGNDITRLSLAQGNERFDFEAMREIIPTAPTLYKNVSPNGRFVVKRSISGTLEVFDLTTDRRLCTLVPLIENKWAIVTPEGRFDTNELENPRGLHWFARDAPLTPLSFEVFMRDYFEPRLLQRLSKCTVAGNCNQEFKTVRDLSTLNRVQPKIAITGIVPTGSPGTVEVSVEVNNVVNDYQHGSRGRGLESGVYDVKLFRDGQLVGYSTLANQLQATFRAYRSFDEELAVWREANKVALINGKKTLTFKVRLPNSLPDKQVEFSAYAFNNDRVKSETARASYVIPADKIFKSEPRKAYLITFGVNNYDNPQWDLQFSCNDARAMSRIVSSRLRQRNEFTEVIEIPLIADRSPNQQNRMVSHRDATKGNVQSVFELLAGRTLIPERRRALEKTLGQETLLRIGQAKPDDLILMSFSSHGYADRNGVFYVLPTDIGKDSGSTVSGELLRRSISSDELSLWLRDVDAGEMVMIVDACHAASAVEGKDFKPGPMGSRGLGQLAFDKGMKILTATQAANVAIETGGTIGHGLLTFALLSEGLEQNKADFRLPDKIINLKEWLEYGEFRVPGLYDDLSSGKLKGIGKAKAELVGIGRTKLLDPTIQQPSLFDFTRKKSEMVLVQLP